MERKFPKNVRQIGNVCDTPKIYMEDYVDTYLNQLKENAGEEPAAAFLVGERVKLEGETCVYITGAVQLGEVNYEGGELRIPEEALRNAEEERQSCFPGKEAVGWFLVSPGKPLAVNDNIQKLHRELFDKQNTIFMMRHPEENEEIFFAYKYHELMQMGGYYIFYEKNPSMQNYMISKRRQIGVTPSEVVEDRAAKDFRSAIRDKMERNEQKSNSKFVYITSALLVVMVLAIGVSAMNNYDKMNSVQSSIETLSRSVGDSDETDAKALEREKKEAEAGKGENVSDTEPATSTIQEELADEEYYTVQRGDTLDKISLKLYGTTAEADAICKMNGLTDGNLIYIGQKLLLP